MQYDERRLRVGSTISSPASNVGTTSVTGPSAGPRHPGQIGYDPTFEQVAICSIGYAGDLARLTKRDPSNSYRFSI